MELVLCLELSDFGVVFALTLFFFGYIYVCFGLDAIVWIYIYIVGHLIMH
jgi:hypothetical protein